MAAMEAKVLAFERKLDFSDGLFKSGTWDSRAEAGTWTPVPVREKAIRGTISNKAKKLSSIEESVRKPNLQRVDVASIAPEHDSFELQFTCKVLGNVGKASSCDNSEYQAKLLEKVDGYKEQHGFTELARRYAINLANGRFLWRNRLGAEEIEIHVERMGKGQATKTWIFSGFDFSLQNFEAPASAQSDISELAAAIEAGFTSSGGGDLAILKIRAYGRIGQGQEVYPSEELVMDQGNAKGSKSKTLYAVNGTAGFHSQKLGNAVRCIDTWYEPDAARPIAIEPYGSVTNEAKAYRLDKNDLYTLMEKKLLMDKDLAPEEFHFVIANLIRGGVFGG